MKIALAFDVRRAPLVDHVADPAATLTLASANDQDEVYETPAEILAIAGALEALGHEVDPLGDGPDALRKLLVNRPPPDLVFNMAEGRGYGRCRQARLPAALELMKIPYTGSDPLALAASQDKDVAKRLVAQRGVATPPWVAIRRDGLKAASAAVQELRFPVIVKPCLEGASRGIVASSLCDTPEEAIDRAAEIHGRYLQTALVEQFVDGDEVTVAFIGNSPPAVLGIQRTLPVAQGERPFVKSLEVRRAGANRMRQECPAELDRALQERLEAAAFAAWRAIDLRDVARIDFRIDAAGEPWFLEANATPGVAPQRGSTTLIARAMGVAYDDLLRRLVAAAASRFGLNALLTGAR